MTETGWGPSAATATIGFLRFGPTASRASSAPEDTV